MADGDFVDFTIKERDVRGLRWLLAMGMLSLKRLDRPFDREAVRVGCKVLKLLNPVAREINAENAPKMRRKALKEYLSGEQGAKRGANAPGGSVER